MKTIIFDLDGTLCELRDPLASSIVFLSRAMIEVVTDTQFALVTGGTREEVEFVLKKAGVEDLFFKDLILTREDPFGEKKTGKPFREILRRVKGRAIVIGDSESDRLGSERAGLRCIFLAQEQSLTRRIISLEKAIKQAKNYLS